MKLSKYVSVLLLLLFMCVPCVSEADTHNAASCGNADITTAITAAASGDTVSVPAGNCTWTSTVTIPSDKILYLVGAGSGADGTVITRGASVQLSAQSADYTISGFRFLNQTAANLPMIDAKNIGWRIHHNYFGHVTPGTETRGTTEAIVATGANDSVSGRHPAGLIDNNTFADQRIVVYGESSLANQNTIWAQENVFGSADSTVFVEDNTFTDRLTGNVMDSNNAAKYVFRYNTVSPGTNIMAHSLQSAATRGAKSWEIYGNSLNLITGYSSVVFLRAGTGLAFNNSATFASTYYSNVASMYLDNVRSSVERTTCCGANPPPVTDDSGACNGTSLWDGNVGSGDAAGWPCRDQIGRGQDTGSDSSVIGKATSSEPAYFWGNYNATKSSFVPVTVSSDAYSQYHIVANRDYYDRNASFDGTSGVGCGTLASRPATCTTGVGYWATDQSCSDLTGMVGANPVTPISGTLHKCTETDTWTAYYTPYTYPHPLRDVTAPDSTITQSDPQAITSDALTLTGTCTDAVGVTSAKYRLSSSPDGSDGTACTGTTSWTCNTGGYSIGANDVYVGCADAAGNWTSPAPHITANFSYPSGAIAFSSPGTGAITMTPNNAGAITITPY